VAAKQVLELEQIRLPDGERPEAVKRHLVREKETTVPIDCGQVDEPFVQIVVRLS